MDEPARTSPRLRRRLWLVGLVVAVVALLVTVRAIGGPIGSRSTAPTSVAPVPGDPPGLHRAREQ